MKKTLFIQISCLFITVMSMFIVSCSDNKHANHAAEQEQTYTCSMHPQIVQNKPGTCPICGMELVPFDRSNQDASLTLNESQRTLANITTVVAGSSSLSNTKQLNGRLVTDPSQSAVISSRVAGRIEELYVRETGVPVTRGQRLFKIYSEVLASLQQEYLIAYAQLKEFPGDSKFRQIEKAARQKLSLYDQSPAQIDALISDQQISPYVIYPANVSGVISELFVSEGQYVSEGSPLARVENYGQLWVEADLYPAEAASIKEGQVVQVVIAGWEEIPQQMKIQFVNPSLQRGSQLLKVRGSIPNVNSKWQAGLQANILLPMRRKSNVLTLPVDAVIRDSRGSLVWIETAKGKFEPRMVTTGVENFDVVEITEGLDEGDSVVVTGAYLLNSEYILKKGANPMATHQH
jgi:membrane fusion protein, copper/silver efflux system